jgi:hypothetical protein
MWVVSAQLVTSAPSVAFAQSVASAFRRTS